jgi:hypothetical protein
VVLTGVAGTVGARYSALDREQTLEAEGRAAGPCTLGDDEDAATDEAEHCATPAGACGGACALCPRAEMGAGEAQA